VKEEDDDDNEDEGEEDGVGLCEGGVDRLRRRRLVMGAVYNVVNQTTWKSPIELDGIGAGANTLVGATAAALKRKHTSPLAQ